MKTRLIDEGGKMLVAVADVKVTRNRFRPAEKIPQLSESLKTYEQLQPIIIERDGELVDGFRRLNAAKASSWKSN